MWSIVDETRFVARYAFTQVDSSSMVLVRASQANLKVNSMPLYHISHRMNPFIPFSIITTVRRGGEPDGEVVGSFQ
jgi:hypothetical protein